jgi:exodeoxyribonuclease-3
VKIISYNINGIRAVLKKDFITWLKAANPDVLCLQELKANEDQFDASPFQELGYNFFLYSAEKKGYSGVAILCKEEPKNVSYGCGIKEYDVEGRIIRCDFEHVSVMSVYMPSGASKPERQDFKLKYLTDFRTYVSELRKDLPKLVICGDFNLCHRSIDIHNPYGLDGYPGFTEVERNWMTSFLEDGFVDTFRELNPDPDQYSWWSYRSGARSKNLGWRIDYILSSESLNGDLKRSMHLTEARHSDHCPVVTEFQ